MTTRAEFLERIRTEMRKTSGLFPARPADRPSRPREAADTVRREMEERWPQTLDRFRQEFERVGGVFHRAAGAGDVADVVVRIARERQVSRTVAWHVLGRDLAPRLTAAGLAVDVAPAASPADDEAVRVRTAGAHADVGLTGADLAIADTGTLVLRSGAGRPRSTSLLPPTHVAVFDRTALIESLAQLGVFLEAWHAEDADGSGAMISLITGPSRTADIELTLTRGVHGPKEVHAIFVDTAIGG